MCAQEMIGGREVIVYCSGVIDIDGQGQIAYQASKKRPETAGNGRAEVTGVVTGGTGAFLGARGELRLIPPESGEDVWTARFR
jgi:hypothetical protein